MKKKFLAPIDNKNLMEDAFLDDVFADFCMAKDHFKNHNRHLIGNKTVFDENGIPCESGLVDVAWNFGENNIRITLLAVPYVEDWYSVREWIFEDYKKTFKSWECEDNPDLVVDFFQMHDTLSVIFYFEHE